MGTSLARAALLVMGVVLAANVMLGVFAGGGGGSAARPVPSPSRSPRAVIEDVATALSGPVTSGGFSRDLRLRRVSVRRVGSSVILEGTGELLVPEQGGRGTWWLGVDVRRTALVLAGGDWLALRDASGVALVRDGEPVSAASWEWVPGVPRRIQLVFPAPPESEVKLMVTWAARYSAWSWGYAEPRTVDVRL